MPDDVESSTAWACPFCGYDLRAQIEVRAERCSECGLLLPRIPAEPEKTYVERYRRCLEGMRAGVKNRCRGDRDKSSTGCGCPVCGHDLCAQIETATEHCPECGLVLPRIAAEPAETYEARYRHCLEALRARLKKGWHFDRSWPERSRVREWLGRFKRR